MRILFRGFLLSLTVFQTAMVTAPAQTLSARPSTFTDPTTRPASQYGDLILGRTTLTGAQHIFAEEMSLDQVRISRIHGPNPSRLPDTSWRIGQFEVVPRFQLDLGPGYYTLYFDHNERLLVLLTQMLPRRLTGKELKAQYPAFREDQMGRSGSIDDFDALSVQLDSCVTLIAHVRVEDDRVEQIGYAYTCPTTATVSAGNTSYLGPEPR